MGIPPVLIHLQMDFPMEIIQRAWGSMGIHQMFSNRLKNQQQGDQFHPWGLGEYAMNCPRMLMPPLPILHWQVESKNCPHINTCLPNYSSIRVPKKGHPPKTGLHEQQRLNS
jgi:hypothetical protein